MNMASENRNSDIRYLLAFYCIWFGIACAVFVFMLSRYADLVSQFPADTPVWTMKLIFHLLYCCPPGVFLVYAVLGFSWLLLWPDQDSIANVQGRVIGFPTASGVFVWLFSKADMDFLFDTVFFLFFSICSQRVIRLHTDPQDHTYTMKWKLAAGMVSIIIYSFIFEMMFGRCFNGYGPKDIALCTLFMFVVLALLYPFVPIVGMAIGRGLSNNLFRKR